MLLGAVIGLVVGGGACSRPSFRAGEPCELNSDCEAPLVCRLDRCRAECRGLRDCPVGLLCLRDDSGLGACQVEDECDLSSDCPASLVCAAGRCTNECEADVDCPAGASCQPTDDGVLGCVDVSEAPCDLNSHCAPGFLCAPDRRCREPCRADRDCRDGRSCLRMGPGPSMCGTPPVGPDGGTSDGGTSDGGTSDGGTSDGGVLLPAPPSAGVLAGGSFHTCVYVAGSGLSCWGRWRDPTGATLHFEYTSPTSVPLGGLVPNAIVSSGNHDCLTDGTLHCWGDNTGGQLARDPGTLPSSETPVAIALGFPVHAAATGLSHTCAVAEGSGEVWCWGDNTNGQLGHAGSGPTPAPVVGLAMPAMDVSARSQSTCALLVDGTVQCWGRNDRSQLGTDGGAGDSMTPVSIAGLAGAAEVDVGTDFVCARVEPGGVIRCWGANDGGQLAISPTGGTFASPQTVALPRPAVEIETGLAHACARLDDGTVHCWGLNATDAVGHPTNLFVTTPFAVASGMVEVSTGEIHTCARSDASTVFCWGSNSSGQLGNSGPTTPTPTQVPGL